MKTTHELRGYHDFWATVKTSRFQLTPENTCVCTFSNRYPLKTTNITQWIKDENREYVMISLRCYSYLKLYLIARRVDRHTSGCSGISLSALANDLKAFGGFYCISTRDHDEISCGLHYPKVWPLVNAIAEVLPKPPRRGTRFLKTPVNIKAQTPSDRYGFYKIYRNGDLEESHDYGDCSMVLPAIAVYIC